MKQRGLAICGRYYRTADKRKISEAFRVEATSDSRALCSRLQHRAADHPAGPSPGA